jgi:hypothetical protein
MILEKDIMKFLDWILPENDPFYLIDVPNNQIKKKSGLIQTAL